MSSADDQKTIEELKEAAKLTILSNRVSEIQEKNMKMFPLVMFNGVRGVVLEWDLGNRSDSYVTYRLNIDDSEPNFPLEKRFLALENAIRGIFWKDVSIKVYFNDSKVYDSKKTEKK